MSPHLTPTQIENLMITAIEGGINYWADNIHLPNSYAGPFQIRIKPYGDRAVTFTDQDLIRALNQFPRQAQELFDETYDADTADVLIQAAAFGDVIYG